MPDFLRDWHIWWLDFWDANPVVFWAVLAVALALTFIARRWK